MLRLVSFYPVVLVNSNCRVDYFISCNETKIAPPTLSVPPVDMLMRMSNITATDVRLGHHQLR